MSGSMIGGLGFMVADNKNPGDTLHVLHNLRKHHGRREHQGKVFTYLGGVEGH